MRRGTGRSFSSMHSIVILLVALIFVQVATACFITNCPIGGKRSLLNSQVQCARCGFDGQCYGPAICCNGQGCRLGHPEDVRQCSVENRSVIPCKIDAPSCSTLPNGRCAARGLCCNPDSCRVDENCSAALNESFL